MDELSEKLDLSQKENVELRRRISLLEAKIAEQVKAYEQICIAKDLVDKRLKNIRKHLFDIMDEVI